MKITYYSIILIIISLFCTNSLFATVGNGSKISPFKTIEEALSFVEEGDTIHITSGKYSPSNGVFTINKSIVIIGSYDENFETNNTAKTLLCINESATKFDEIANITLTKSDNPYALLDILSETTSVTIQNINIQTNYTAKNQHHTKQSLISIHNRILTVNSASTYNYALYDTLGRCIQRAEQQSANKSISLLQLPKGVYIISVYLDNKQEAIKVTLY